MRSVLSFFLRAAWFAREVTVMRGGWGQGRVRRLAQSVRKEWQLPPPPFARSIARALACLSSCALPLPNATPANTEETQRRRFRTSRHSRRRR